MSSDRVDRNDSSVIVVGADGKKTTLGLIESELTEELRKPGVPASEKLRSVFFRLMQRHELYSGPLPSADQFQGYEDACPGSADRILEMAEKEQAHRHSWENSQLSFEHRYTERGLWMGLVIALLLVSGAVCTAFIGQQTVALSLVAASTVGIVTKFIDGRIFPKDRSSTQAPQEPAKSSPQPTAVKAVRRKR